MSTHEAYLSRVRDIVIGRFIATDADTEAKRRVLATAKVTYGGGQPNLRGYCVPSGWQIDKEHHPFIEVCAHGEENRWQLAGTLIHELAHALVPEAGHSKVWRVHAGLLGLRRANAAGHQYIPASFEPELREALYRLPDPSDGAPALRARLGGFRSTGATCKMGIGTKGGTSRGAGSGSRLRLYECECAPKPVKIRAATDELKALCLVCGKPFQRQGEVG